MKLFYGVVGEGMGHATRSRVVIQHLLEAGHTVRVVVSGRACGLLRGKLAGRPNVQVDQIVGLHMAYEGNAVDVGRSIVENRRPTA